MAIIDKKTFEIWQETDIEEIEKNSFECDDEIAQTISILNLKGYITKSSCAGHPFKSNDVVYMAGNTQSHILFQILGGYASKKLNDDEINEKCPNYKKYNEPVYEIKYKNRLYTCPYIVFESGYMPKRLPKGWKINKDNQDEIYFEYDEFEDEFDFFAQKIQIMKELRNWAESLRKKK